MWHILAALLIFVCALRSGSEIAHAETAPPAEGIVKSALTALIRDLQVKAVLQKQGDKTAYFPQGPIDAHLAAVGKPIRVSLSAPVESQGLFNYTAGVDHARGTSQWAISTTEDGIIISSSFVVKLTVESPESGALIFNPESLARLKTMSQDTGKFIMFAPAPPLVDPRVVEFLFATTRQAVLNSPVEGVVYTGDRGPLSFGAASVRIPEDHKIGHIELPSSWKIFGISLYTQTPNEDKHFIIKRVTPLTADTFGANVREKGAKSALVFVHGFNNSFDDSVYRAAQIFWDLQYQGLPVLFTWASRGDKTDYTYDKESANLAQEAFIELLKKLHSLGIEQVNVIAHSMGNLITVDALANYAQTSDPVQIARLVMAAPDVDRDVFEQLAPKAKAIVAGMTLYASSADLAMTVSRRLAGGIPRAGDVPAEGPIVLPNIETIDVTAVGDEFLGVNHDTFAASRDVIEDIAALLRGNQAPPRLSQIRQVPDPPAAARYWRFVP